MTIEDFKHNPAGYIAVMRSPEMRLDLDRRADAVHRVVADRLDSLGVDGVDLWSDTTDGRTRAGGTVAGVPIAVEQAHRVLGGALDAADV